MLSILRTVFRVVGYILSRDCCVQLLLKNKTLRNVICYAESLAPWRIELLLKILTYELTIIGSAKNQRHFRPLMPPITNIYGIYQIIKDIKNNKRYIFVCFDSLYKYRLLFIFYKEMGTQQFLLSCYAVSRRVTEADNNQLCLINEHVYLNNSMKYPELIHRMVSFTGCHV